MTTELEQEHINRLKSVRSHAFCWFLLGFYLMIRMSFTFGSSIVQMPLYPRVLTFSMLFVTLGGCALFFGLSIYEKYLDFQATGSWSIAGIPSFSLEWKYLRIPILCAVVFEIAMLLGRWLVVRG